MGVYASSRVLASTASCGGVVWTSGSFSLVSAGWLEPFSLRAGLLASLVSYRTLARFPGATAAV